jgi:hypothetical protein
MRYAAPYNEKDIFRDLERSSVEAWAYQGKND